MSTTQELIDGLRAADGRLPALGRLHAYPDAPSVRDLVLLSADRLASLSAELAALKAKLAGVMALAQFGDACMDCWPEGSIDGFELQDMLKDCGLIAPVEGGFREAVHLDAHNCCPAEGDEWLMPTQAAVEARAAIAAYLAAVRDGE